jgi:hypothetical protein
VPLRTSGKRLIVPPFRITQHGLTYESPTELRIDLSRLRPARYRVLAVQNFHVEDCNPQLDECMAGVFLAARTADGWEDPEAFPVECRTLEVLGEVEIQ